MWFIGLFVAIVFYIASILVCRYEDMRKHTRDVKNDPQNTPPRYWDDIRLYQRDLDKVKTHFEKKQIYADAINSLLEFVYVGQEIRILNPDVVVDVNGAENTYDYYVIRCFQRAKDFPNFRFDLNSIPKYTYRPNGMCAINHNGFNYTHINTRREKIIVNLILVVCAESDYIDRSELVEFKDKPRPGIDKKYVISNQNPLGSDINADVEIYDGNNYVNACEYIKSRINLAIKINDDALSKGFDMSELINIRPIDDYTKYHR